MTTGGRLSFLALTATVLTGCQPLADFRTKIRFPAEADVPLDSMHYELEFRGRVLEKQPSMVELESSGLVVEYRFDDIGLVMLTVWADLDSDGTKSPGDLVGQFDREFKTGSGGLFGLRSSQTPDIVLKPWTP